MLCRHICYPPPRFGEGFDCSFILIRQIFPTPVNATFFFPCSLNFHMSLLHSFPHFYICFLNAFLPLFCKFVKLSLKWLLPPIWAKSTCGQWRAPHCVYVLFKSLHLLHLYTVISNKFTVAMSQFQITCIIITSHVTHTDFQYSMLILHNPYG
jgi:hypothetical protein